MFGLGGKAVTKTAHLLMQRAIASQTKYLHLSHAGVVNLVKRDFPEGRQWCSHDQVSFIFDDLADFSFVVMWMLERSSMAIYGGGAYDGFMLQTTRGSWHVDVSKPLSRPTGAKADKLSAALVRDFGVRDLQQFRAQLESRFR